MCIYNDNNDNNDDDNNDNKNNNDDSNNRSPGRWNKTNMYKTNTTCIKLLCTNTNSIKLILHVQN